MLPCLLPCCLLCALLLPCLAALLFSPLSPRRDPRRLAPQVVRAKKNKQFSSWLDTIRFGKQLTHKAHFDVWIIGRAMTANLSPRLPPGQMRQKCAKRRQRRQQRQQRQHTATKATTATTARLCVLFFLACSFLFVLARSQPA